MTSRPTSKHMRRHSSHVQGSCNPPYWTQQLHWGITHEQALQSTVATRQASMQLWMSCRVTSRHHMLHPCKARARECTGQDVYAASLLGASYAPCSLPVQGAGHYHSSTVQGHIALDQAVFPETTPGLALDTLARMHLWRIGLNYRHGTGHGVGAALNVHEGPMSISTR